MKLTTRDGGRFVLNYTDKSGKRVRKSLGTRDKQKAEKLASKFLASIEVKKKAKVCNLTVAEGLDICFDEVWQHTKGWEKKRNQIALIKAHQMPNEATSIGDMRLSDVTTAFFAAYQQFLLGEGLKPSSANRYCSDISKAINHAAYRGFLSTGIKYKRLKENNKKDNYFTADQEAALLAACDQFDWGKDMKNLIVFLIDTGCRAGEGFAAVKNRTASVVNGVPRIMLEADTTKGAKIRAVPLTERAHEAYKNGWCFTDPDSAGYYFGKVRDAADKLGMAEVMGNGYTLHTLRHTCASRLVLKGVDLYRVKTWLGHAKVTTTERYAHLDTRALDSLVDLLSV